MNEIIHTFTPEQLKEIVLIIISNSIEQNAKARGSTLIEKEDLVKAFLTGTPYIFQRQMRAILRRKGIYVEKEDSSYVLQYENATIYTYFRSRMRAL